MLEDVIRLVEAANYNAYVDKETGEPLLSRKEFDEVCSIDPTPTKTYAKWLLSQYLKAKKTGEAEGIDPDEIHRLFIEDGEARVGPALSVFNDLKRNPEKAKEDGINLDIGAYTIPKLEDLATRYANKKDQFISKSAAEKDANIIYEDEHWKILIPKSHLAARKYGTGTHWCTAVDNPAHYDRYTKSGPLVIIIDKTKPAVTPKRNQNTNGGLKSHRWQIHVSSNQFKDAADTEVQDRAAVLQLLPPKAREALANVGVSLETYRLSDIFSYQNREKGINAEEVKQLLAAGGDPHIQNEAVLKWAVREHETEIVDQLIKDPRTSREVLANLVADAVTSFNFVFVHTVVDTVGPDAINANGAVALVNACTYPMSLEESKIFEKAKKAVGENIKKKGHISSRDAVEIALGPTGIAQYDQLNENVKVYYERMFPMIRYLVEHGADVNGRDNKALGNICMWSNDTVLQIIEYLIQHGAEVNGNRSFAYWQAYNNFRPKVLKLLTSHGGQSYLSSLGETRRFRANV